MKRPVIWKGLAAGFVGGLVASGAMSLFHGALLKLFRAPAPAAEDSTAKVARTVVQPILHRKLNESEAGAGGKVVHYAFGSSNAAAYGVAAEFVPAVTRGAGLPFGIALWLGAHVVTVPALGLSPPVMQSPLSTEIVEFLAHLVYGGLTEFIRSRLRRWPGERGLDWKGRATG